MKSSVYIYFIMKTVVYIPLRVFHHFFMGVSSFFYGCFIIIIAFYIPLKVFYHENSSLCSFMGVLSV